MAVRHGVGGALTGVLIGISLHGAAAQPALTGTILSGASLSGGAGGSARLALGARVASPPRSWTEIVFSDGSSIVLGPGAELTVRQLAPGSGSGRNRITAAGSGQIRVAAMDATQVELAVAGAAVTVIAAEAVLQAVPHGSIAMIGGQEVVVAQRSRRDTLRRPGFSVPLDGSGPQRDSERQLVAALTPFASPDPARPPADAEAAAPPTPSKPLRAVRAGRSAGPSTVAAPLVPTEIAAAGPTDLSTGLTAQSGSFVPSPALRGPATTTVIAAVAPTLTVSTATVPTSAVTPAIIPASVSPISTVVTPAAPNNTIPEIQLSPFVPAPPVTAPPSPEIALLVPTQPPFVTVDSALLAKFSSTSGLVTLPGTTTSVSAGLVPSNEHLAWGFAPIGSTSTPAMAVTNPYVTFSINSTALPAGSLQTLTGTATYTGGLIANTLGTSGNLRPTGQFAQTWNFGTRSGAINAVFDGSTWRGIALTTLPTGFAGYSGGGTSTTDQRSIFFSGSFFNSTSVTSSNLPNAIGGNFSVGGTSTGRLPTGGLFVGTRR